LRARHLTKSLGNHPAAWQREGSSTSCTERNREGATRQYHGSSLEHAPAFANTHAKRHKTYTQQQRIDCRAEPHIGANRSDVICLLRRLQVRHQTKLTTQADNGQGA
jgi:hypothetical protein